MFVCTGNICRSPMAEALLRARVADVGLSAGVSSAGELFDDRPAEPGAIDAMDRLGIDLSEHRSRVWTPELARGADLVITMEQRHVYEVVVAIGALGTTFTFPDLVARARAHGPRGIESMRDYLDILTREWPAGTRVDGTDLDVLDPMGQSHRAFRRCAAQLGDLVDALVPLAWPGASRLDARSLPPVDTRST
ncbi:MAG: low molecular weight phosphatase family protein [Acidimicrobiales bacterium]